MNTNASLRELATRAGVHFGAAAVPGLLTRAPRYAALLASNCTVLVAENHMKMKYLQPHYGIFNFSAADTLLHFAEQHGQRMRGHTLIWHCMPPSWLETTSWSRAELLDILHSHITTVMHHYKGRVYAWDVVNEAISDDGSLRTSLCTMSSARSILISPSNAPTPRIRMRSCSTTITPPRASIQNPMPSTILSAA